MKITNCLIPLAILVIGAGCRSADTHSSVTTSSTSRRVVQTTAPQTAQSSATEAAGQTVQRGTVGNFIFTVKVIPNQRLSATSREGDKPTEVYSSNIIGVYVQPRDGVTANSTNSAAVPQGYNLEPGKK